MSYNNAICITPIQIYFIYIQIYSFSFRITQCCISTVISYIARDFHMLSHLPTCYTHSWVHTNWGKATWKLLFSCTTFRMCAYRNCVSRKTKAKERKTSEKKSYKNGVENMQKSLYRFTERYSARSNFHCISHFTGTQRASIYIHGSGRYKVQEIITHNDISIVASRRAFA